MPDFPGCTIKRLEIHSMPNLQLQNGPFPKLTPLNSQSGSFLLGNSKWRNIGHGWNMMMKYDEVSVWAVHFWDKKSHRTRKQSEKWCKTIEKEAEAALSQKKSENFSYQEHLSRPILCHFCREQNSNDLASPSTLGTSWATDSTYTITGIIKSITTTSTNNTSGVSREPKEPKEPKARQHPDIFMGEMMVNQWIQGYPIFRQTDTW